MFQLEKPDLLPLGDLGVRNGIQRHFGIPTGAGKKGALHEVKDAPQMDALLEPFRPYRTLAVWYMWRALDSTSFDEAVI